MAGVRPLLDTVVDMTDASAERAELDPRVLMMVRLGALAAVGAPAASYLSNLASASDAGLTFEEARSVLIAVAPIVGTPRVVVAAGTIAETLGIALALDDALAGEAVV
jgi:alkylhydroperoxidase/carboxymuconolactone decarboxylase family protein YurZ